MKVSIDKSKFNEEKVITQKVFSNENCVVVLFYLKKGQKVSLHSSPSTVITTVLYGKGKFFVNDENTVEDLKQGESYIYKPKQPHGFLAEEDMVVQAVISPNPSVFNKINL